jgi:lipopolysaccharide transport system ATP-binding protein
MANIALRADGLGKTYRIGMQRHRYLTLRDALTETAVRIARAPSSLIRRGGDEYLWALRDVSFELRHGEVLGLVGSNGAGKSTLLKVLSRITPPTTGRAVIRGRVGSLLEVGTGFHPELSGRENIFLNGAILGMRRNEIARKFDEIVAFAGVERFLETPVKHYSSGMYMRLAFAVAAHLEPEILLIDEVLAVGDAAFQRKCLGKISDIVADGRTVVFVSHNMAAVQTFCSRAICLREGRIIEDGPPNAVVGKYLQTSHESQNDRLWTDPRTAPGNEKVMLRRARVVREDGEDAPITIRVPFRLEFEYWNLQPDARLNLSLHIYNEHGIIAFNAVPLNEPNWMGRSFPVGLFHDTCRIPGDLLNDGVHRVELLIVQDDATVIYRMDDVLVFDVQDAAELRGTWYGRFVGAVRPLLDWRTELLQAGEPRNRPSANVREARGEVEPA